MSALPSIATTSTATPIFFISPRMTAQARSSSGRPFCVSKVKRAGRLPASSSVPSPLRSTSPIAASFCLAAAGSWDFGIPSQYHFLFAGVIGP